MFGYYRFLLSLLVVFSHLEIKFYGMNIGVIAVISFYMLAGYVVCGLVLKSNYKDSFQLRKFYYERFLRIYPLYSYVLILTVAFFLITEFGGGIEGDSIKIISNILVVPLNYYMFLDSNLLFDNYVWLIPPSWSIGVELQAYMLLPLVVLLRSVKYIFTIVSAFIFLVACLDVINTDIYGYRLLPGVFFVFILGTAIYKKFRSPDNMDRFDDIFVKASMPIALIMSGLTMLAGTFSLEYVRETLVGLIIAILTISIAARKNIRIPYNQLLGSLSYGIFLSHSLAIWIIEYFTLVQKSKSLSLYIIAVLFISITISLVGNLLIEARIKRLRYQLTNTRIEQ